LAARYQVSATCLVGYVNIPLTNGYNFINLQLLSQDHPTHTVSEVFSTNAPDGTQVYLWDGTNQIFTPPSVYSASAKAWSIDYPLATGPGFVATATQSFTLTTVGVACDGSFTNFVAGTNKWSLLGFTPPLSISLAAASFPLLDGANVLLYYNTNQTFSDAFTGFAGYGWFDPNGRVDASGPVLAVSQPFFIQNLGPDTNWIQNFRIQASSSALVPNSTTAEIQSLNIHSGLTTLRVHNAAGARYNIQFSTDGLAWTTIASNHTGSVWTGKWPAGARGCYRLTAP